jgi:hypothetical protein
MSTKHGSSIESPCGVSPNSVGFPVPGLRLTEYEFVQLTPHISDPSRPFSEVTADFHCPGCRIVVNTHVEPEVGRVIALDSQSTASFRQGFCPVPPSRRVFQVKS